MRPRARSFASLAGAMVVSLVAIPAEHSLATIVQGTELAPYGAVTNQLSTSHGAVFSSLNSPFVTFIELVPGTWGIQGTEPWANPLAGYAWFNSPIYIGFVDPSDGVSPATVSGTITINWGDGGGDLDAVDVLAYDLSNTLLSTTTASGVGFTQFQVSGAGIARLEFIANTTLGSPTSDTGIDWIDFPTPVGVPGPGAAAMILVCGARVLMGRRRGR